MEEATAYKAQVITKAEGEASRFTQVLTEYRKAPEVTRKRIYLDAVEKVLSNSSKVLITVENGNNMLFLPLDRFLGGKAGLPETLSGASQMNAQQMNDAEERRLRDNLRSRGER
jgi:membrane protease subunit HflK